MLNHQREMMTLSPRFCSITSPGKVHQELQEGQPGKMQILTQECWGSQRVCIPSKLAGDALSAIAQAVLRGQKLGYYLISCASGTLKSEGQFCRYSYKSCDLSGHFYTSQISNF